jgi:hypothetical protein
VPFFEVSTERAELEHFAEAAEQGRPLAVAGGDEEHGVAVMEAILGSARSGATVRPGARPERASSRTADQSAPRALKKTARAGTAPRRKPVSVRRSGRR